MASSPIRIVQISDTHLLTEGNKTLVGVPTIESLKSVMDVIKRKAGEFDMILHTGDLAQDYAVGSYLQLADMLSTFNVPVYCVPGNHDEPDVMCNVYPYKLMKTDRHIVTETWQIIMLNTHKKNAVEGFLADAELKFLDTSLSELPNRYATVFFHHQPLPVGCRWLDKLGLTNANDFWKIIAKYKKVKAIFFGHVHQQFEHDLNGIQCYSVPSTCFQFMRDHDEFSLEDLPPGFRIIKLYEDGRVETEVIRIDHYVGQFEGNCKGY